MLLGNQIPLYSQINTNTHKLIQTFLRMLLGSFVLKTTKKRPKNQQNSTNQNWYILASKKESGIDLSKEGVAHWSNQYLSLQFKPQCAISTSVVTWFDDVDIGLRKMLNLSPRFNRFHNEKASCLQKKGVGCVVKFTATILFGALKINIGDLHLRFGCILSMQLWIAWFIDWMQSKNLDSINCAFNATATHKNTISHCADCLKMAVPCGKPCARERAHHTQFS